MIYLDNVILSSTKNTLSIQPWEDMAAKSLQSCSTLCDPIDGSPSGSLVPGILQARTLEWVAIAFSNAWKWKVKVKLLSRVRLLATPWTAAYQAPPSMGFSRQEYWSGVPLPSPEKTWRKLKCTLLSERRQSEKVMYCRIPTIWHYRKSKTVVKRSVIEGIKREGRINSQESGGFLGQRKSSVRKSNGE